MIMKTTISIAVALSLQASLVSQQIDPPTAWQAFEEQLGSDWTSQWNPATGTPKAIYGPGLKLGAEVSDVASARREALGLLNRFSSNLISSDRN